MKFFSLFTKAVLVSAAIPAAAMAQDGNGQIKAVTLSSGGLAEIAREADVRDDGSITVEVPTDQVNDILKSLVVRDGAGAVRSMSLAGAAGLEETFRKLPFSKDDFASLPRLLSSLQGAEIEATSGGKTLSGRVLGVEERTAADGAAEQILSLLGSEGINTLPLGQDTKVRFLDAEIEKKLGDAAMKAGRRMAEASRSISVSIDGQGERKVFLTYVVPAPVWKTSYRLVTAEDGTARLQAWAILENATGEDWDDVKVTLTSGNPSTLRQELYEPLWRQREEVNVAVASQPTFRADADDTLARPVAPAGARLNAMPQMQMEQSAAGYMAEPVEAAATLEGDVASTFELPGLHDLAEGDTISIPIIDAKVPATQISTYRIEDGSEHPVAAIELKNDTDVSLPGGILTVYDEQQGYAGDSALMAFPAGETRFARFATDSKVRIIHDVQPSRSVVEVKVSDGVLNATVKNVEKTTYSITGANDADRTILIEHPRSQGWTLTSDALDGETQTHYRLKKQVAAGEKVSVVASQERVSAERHALVDASPQILLDWSSSATPETAEKLKELAEARREQEEARRSLDRITADIERITQEQARIRENIGAVPDGSDLQNRYLGMMQSLEDRIAELETSRKEAEEQAGVKDDDVRDIIRTF